MVARTFLRRALSRLALPVCLAVLRAGAQDLYTAEPASDDAASAVRVDAPMARPLSGAAGDPAAVREALAFEAAGNPAGAITRLEAAILDTPDVARLWEVLGLIHWKTGRADEAIATWTRYGVAVGNRAEPHAWIGEVRAARNELLLALESFDRALKLAPNDVETLFQRTRVYRWLGHIEEAAATMKTLVAQHPDRADFRRELAAALFANREYDQASALWARVRRDRPADADAEAREIASRAYATADAESVRSAAAYLERYPENAMILRALADVAESSGHREEALGYLKRLLKIETDPKKKARLAFRAANLISTLRETQPDRFSIQEAVELVQGYLGLHPYDVDVRLLLGELFIEALDWARARESFETVLSTYNPQNVRACRGLFETALATGRHAEAGRWLDRVRRFNPADPYLGYHEARMEAAAMDYDDAFAALDRLERAGASGAVAVLLYHGLGVSDWTEIPSVQILREQIGALREAGYTFVSAHDIPALLKKGEAPQDLARHVPQRVACVTWDDARRDAMTYGTPLGRELGVPMTMHVPVGYVKEDHPFIAGWETLRRCQEEGTWHFSSHAFDGHDPRPALGDGHVVHPLANRLWLPAAGRQETEPEYRARLVHEYRASREAIVTELKRADEADVFAYPFGDIGQLSHSNVTNAPGINLEIAGKYYKVGFIQSHFGHAVKGDNPLLFQRTEPYRAESGSNLLKRLLLTHPVFLARATRAEMATVADKPYLANEMIALLERDGYPAEKLLLLKARAKRMQGGSLFRWPFRRKAPSPEDTPAPAARPGIERAAPPAKTADPAPATAPVEPKTPRPPPGRIRAPADDGPMPGDELRRETGRIF